MDEALPGTERIGASWHSHFRDRHPQQHAQTLTWLRHALQEAAARRDAERRRDGAWLDMRRRELAACSGAHLAPGEIVGLDLAGAGPERSYAIRTPQGVRYSGVLTEPAAGAPRGVVVLAGVAEADSPGVVAAYRAQGIRVIRPDLARTRRSFAEHPERRWYRFTDDELLHVLAFIVGGSLAGLEAGELRATVQALARRADGTPLPTVFDLRGRHALTGLLAAALWSDLTDLLVLDDAIGRLDHQERDERVSTLWGFHRQFDALTLLALTGQSRLLFVEPSATPSATFSRARAWLGEDTAGRERQVIERLDGGTPGDLAAEVARHLPPMAARPPGAAPLTPATGDTPATAEDRYVAALASRLDFLETLHAAARRRREQRFSVAGRTPETYRRQVEESVLRVMGPALPEATDPRPRSRLAHQRPTHAVYEVILESVPGIDVHGYLLLPTGDAPAPAVICQHGLSGRPEYLAGLEENWIYDRLAQRLAEKGYVTFAPFMNWGWGGLEGRDALVKHAYALGMTPNRFEVAQLHAIVDFLQSRPEVRADQIAFYGLSYGGHASLWLSACEPRLAAVVTAGHFNDWQDKLTSTEVTPPLVRPTSYVTVDEGYDMFTFNVLNEIGHAEFATRFAPRPFMVENGLRDTVTPTAWVEREFARVHAVFAWLGAPEQAEIEHFAGPHRIWSEGSFQFLHRHLRAPVPHTSEERDNG